MRTGAIAVLSVLTLAGAVLSCAKKTSDLEAYIDEIRASGVSEMGRSHIYSVASICAGSTVLEYRADATSGRYSPYYTSTTCPNPDADTAELERSKRVRRGEADKLVTSLKRFADADGSGFVTTEEAFDFRRSVEFGYLAAEVIRNEGPKLELIARACGDDVEETARRVGEYRVLARRITEAGVAELPDVAVGTAEGTSE